jgi:hypothetical protein
MIQNTPLLAPGLPGSASPALPPVHLAAAYLRRYTNHVVVNGGPEEMTLCFGQLCPEQPQTMTIEMFASLSLTRGFAQQLVELIQQQLRQTAALGAPPSRPA